MSDVTTQIESPEPEETLPTQPEVRDNNKNELFHFYHGVAAAISAGGILELAGAQDPHNRYVVMAVGMFYASLFINGCFYIIYHGISLHRANKEMTREITEIINSRWIDRVQNISLVLPVVGLVTLSTYFSPDMDLVIIPLFLVIAFAFVSLMVISAIRVRNRRGPKPKPPESH